MKEIIDHTERTLVLLDDAIKKCETHCFVARGHAADLRHQGFSGTEISELVKNLEAALKYAHLYQAYSNAIDS